MGGQQSTPSPENSNGVAIASIRVDENEENIPKGGYSVTFEKESKKNIHKLSTLDEAYEKGKKEGLDTVNQSLSFVAAQVYGNVNQQLLELQENHLKTSQQLVVELEKKLTPLPTGSKYCLAEKSSLTKCLKENKIDALACANFVDIFTKCAYESVASKE